MHSLGFIHTQCRPDRDKYVRILSENIADGMHDSFEKCTTCNIYKDLPYECNSIMHYYDTLFSKGKAKNTTTKK